MQSKTLHDDGQQRTVVLIFETGDRVMETLLAYAKREELEAGHFTAIGALRRVTLGYFEWERRDYRRIEIDEQVEVLSLVGDIALEGSEPRVHAHLVAGRADGAAVGGHLIEGEVRPTLELVLVQPPAHLRRRFDPTSRLALLQA